MRIVGCAPPGSTLTIHCQAWWKTVGTFAPIGQAGGVGRGGQDEGQGDNGDEGNSALFNFRDI